MVKQAAWIEGELIALEDIEYGDMVEIISEAKAEPVEAEGERIYLEERG